MNGPGGSNYLGSSLNTQSTPSNDVTILAMMLNAPTPETSSNGSGSLNSMLGQIVQALLAYEKQDSISNSQAPSSNPGIFGNPNSGGDSGQNSGSGLITPALLRGILELAELAGMNGIGRRQPQGMPSFDSPSSSSPSSSSPTSPCGCGPNGYRPRAANYEPFQGRGAVVNGRPMTSLPGENGSLSGKPQSWQTQASSGKQQVNAALDQAHATPQEKALIMAMGAQETNDFQSSEHDKSKDGTDSANYSAFNLNKYELQKFGFKGDPNALNDQGNIGEAAVTLLNGIREYGADNVMDLTRDGESGENKLNDASAEQWRQGQVSSAEQYLALGPEAMVDNTRIAAPANYQ